MKYVTSFFIILFFLSACSISSHRKAGEYFISNSVETTLIPLSKFSDNVTITNSMESNYKNGNYTATSIVKISKDEMKVIALSDISRIFTITYKNDEIDSEFSVFVPAKDSAPLYILSDIQLIYFPLTAIKSSLPAEMKIVETKDLQGIKREIYCKNQKVIVITYSKSDLYTSDIKFENLERSYSYKITNIGD